MYTPLYSMLLTYYTSESDKLLFPVPNCVTCRRNNPFILGYLTPSTEFDSLLLCRVFISEPECEMLYLIALPIDVSLMVYYQMLYALKPWALINSIHNFQIKTLERILSHVV